MASVTWPSLPSTSDTDGGSPLEEDLFDPIREALEYTAVARAVTIPIFWSQSPSSDPVTATTLASTFGVAEFGASDTPGLLGQFVVPSGYDEDSDLIFHLMVAMKTAEASKNVKFDARVWMFAQDGGIGGGTPTNITETFVPDNDVAYNKWVGSSSNLRIPDGTTDLLRGNIGVVRLERDNAVGSNHSDSAYLLDAWLVGNQ